MFLKSATIRHFKSLDNVAVSFSPITVIVGPNGVGKSNFVDALKFFRDIARDGLDHAVISREGINRIRQIYTSRPYNVGLELGFSGAEGEPDARYELALSGREGEYRVEAERAVYDPSHDSFGFDRRKDGQLVIEGQEFEKRLAPDVVALGQLVDFNALGGSIAEFARQWHFCSLYPNTLRKLIPPRRKMGLRKTAATGQASCAA